jgi:cell division septation protein DedD
MAFVAAGALVLGLAGTALAADPVYATVTGHAPATEDNNHPEAWGDNCETWAISGVDSFVLPELDEGQVYDLVVVKSGSEGTGNNTLFDNPSAGETVFADTNENFAFDAGEDKEISHIIVCISEAEETATPTPTPSPTPEETEQPSTPSPEQTVAGATGTPAPSQPDTAMSVQGGPSPVPTVAFALILLAALGTLAWANVKTVRSRA